MPVPARFAPNATYVGFTGTPIDSTVEVFGDIVDSYTMTESVKDEITVPIVYEGRAAKVLLDNSKLRDIENYYSKCAEEGSNEYQVEESKKAMANMNVIIGDPNRIKAVAEDFVKHYENRIAEGATVKGKAMFVCSSRPIAWDLYKQIIALRPEWTEEKPSDEGAELTEKEKREIKPMERIKMVMTRGQDQKKNCTIYLALKSTARSWTGNSKTKNRTSKSPFWLTCGLPVSMFHRSIPCKWQTGSAA